MILYELLRTEAHPEYQRLEIENGDRQYDFMLSLIKTALALGQIHLSQHVIKMFNFHAIACLHTNAGEYRPCEVTVGKHTPPRFFQLNALMDNFVNEINRAWERTDPVSLATHVYWKINNIHPFINGNGRTARVSAYYALCLRNGAEMPGTPTLPALLKRERAQCVAALQHAHDTFNAGTLDLAPLHVIMTALVGEQLGLVASGP